MGRYFKVIDKHSVSGRDEYCDNILREPDGLYELIEEIVGDMECPCNGIPYKIEVEDWSELAYEGEIYETRDFVVECLSREEYEEYIY